MAKVDNGRRMRVEYANGFKSFLGEKAAEIMAARKNEDGKPVLKIVGPAEEQTKAKKVIVK